MKAIIVDDEISSINILTTLLGKYCPELAIVGICQDIEIGISEIKKHLPDIVFLDIHVGNQNGFDLLEMLGDFSLHVIFITAYDHYAIKAIKFSAIDYLLKPVDPEELMLAVKKCADKTSSGFNKAAYNTLSENMKLPSPQIIGVPNFNEITFLEIANIVWCEADGNYCKIHTKDNNVYVASKTLKHYESLLEGSNFLRIHNSSLINLNCIRKYNKKNEKIEMSDGSNISIAFRKKSEILEYVNKFY